MTDAQFPGIYCVDLYWLKFTDSVVWVRFDVPGMKQSKPRRSCGAWQQGELKHSASSLNIFATEFSSGFEAVKWSKWEVVEMALWWALGLSHKGPPNTRKLSTALIWLKSIIRTWGKFLAFTQLLLRTEETDPRLSKIIVLGHFIKVYMGYLTDGLYLSWDCRKNELKTTVQTRRIMFLFLCKTPSSLYCDV
jgi:hypothetical protein